MEKIKTSNIFFDLFHNCTKQIYREAHKYDLQLNFSPI